MASEAESAAVSDRIEATLRSATAWHLVSIRARPLAAAEQSLAQRLLAAPPAAVRPG